jgi:hypothetical protein
MRRSGLRVTVKDVAGIELTSSTVVGAKVGARMTSASATTDMFQIYLNNE